MATDLFTRNKDQLQAVRIVAMFPLTEISSITTFPSNCAGPWLAYFGRLITAVLSCSEPSRSLPMMEPLLGLYDIIQSVDPLAPLLDDVNVLVQNIFGHLLERARIPNYISDSVWLREQTRKGACESASESFLSHKSQHDDVDIDVISGCQDLQSLR